MSKAVMISIRPKWCNLIESGKKTIEVRKTRPKIEAPFKCYIYCTLVGTKEYFHSITEELGVYESQRKWNKEKWYDRKGKIIGEFVCDAIQEWEWEPAAYEEAEEGESAYNILTVDGEKTGMEYDEFEEYGNKKTLYGWHISDLVIYDQPKELCEFYKAGFETMESLDEGLCKYCLPTNYGELRCYSTPNGYVSCEGGYCCEAYQSYLDENFALIRPPQSWYYVEELK